MNGGVLRLLYFIALVPLNWLAFHWLWLAILDSAGLTREKVWKKRARGNNFGNTSRRLAVWMIRRSGDPGRTKRLIRRYELGSAPMVLCVGLSVFGLYSEAFDAVLAWAAWIMPAIILTAGICGLCCRRRRREAGENAPERKTLAQDFKALKHRFYDREREKQLKRYGGSRARLFVSEAVKLVLALGLMTGLCFVVTRSCVGPGQKQAVGFDEMKAAVEAYGVSAVDRTEQYEDAWQAHGRLERVLAAQADGLTFEFSIFKEEDDASSLWTQYERWLDERSDGMTRIGEGIGNYRIVTLQGGERYEALVQVGNTVVRASSGAGDSYVIREVLMKTGYYFEN